VLGLLVVMIGVLIAKSNGVGAPHAPGPSATDMGQTMRREAQDAQAHRGQPGAPGR
jgi:hypothetical protein